MVQAMIIMWMCSGLDGQAPSLKRAEQITGKTLIFYQVDLLDKDGLSEIFKQHKIDFVIHFAAMKAVGESMQKPLFYYKSNVVSTINLLEAMIIMVMKENGVYNMVFSSSCVVYGNPQYLPIDESHPIGHVPNVYGRTKFAIEQMLEDICRAEKLAGSSWGSDANTLRTSALALVFSTAEYCAPVWEGSCHTKLIDTQLNSTLRIITGVCQPTRIDWLPVLAHISPPELRRKEATKKMYQKLLDSPDLEINPILQSPPNHRLKSRKPIWSRGNQLLSQNFSNSEAWTNSWISTDIPNKNLITSPNVKIPGFSLPRREWVLLNRFRTGQGRCAELMKLWGYTKDPNCACNVPQSMSHILDDCPLYKFNGGISNLHSVTPEALNWLKDLPLRL
ncbi:hypothetical protein LAZ67_13001998 [Cordylochernes scorpioides]|uniref:NAD(P)-binding domain-containing protein n=1 Tax=Cordylochernes scorpioides TaxID=51811 RepID=A0ABY6L937_9ARAC|nr:hypothetical protein LAZ67_13001998 [Cordylochernes scorpioides]